MQERISLGQFCRKMKGDSTYWGQIAKDFGLQPTADPLSHQALCQRISGVYTQLFKVGIFDQKSVDRDPITNFQRHLRKDFDRLLDCSVRFPNQPVPLSVEQKRILYRAAAELPCHMAKAIEKGQGAVVEGLIDEGARPNEYLLDMAIEVGQLPSVVAMLKKISPDLYHLELARQMASEVDRRIYQAIVNAIRKNPLNEEFANKQMRHMFKCQCRPAVAADDFLSRFLAGYRPDNGKEETNSLIQALRAGNRGKIDFLLKTDAYIPDISKKTIEEILMKMMKNQTFFIYAEALRSRGFSFTRTQLLHAYIEFQDEQKVFQLLQMGTLPNFETLERAVHRQNIPILNFVISFIRGKLRYNSKKQLLFLSKTARETKNPQVIRLVIKLYLYVWNLKIRDLPMPNFLNMTIESHDPIFVKMALDAGEKPKNFKGEASEENSVMLAVCTKNLQIIDLINQ